MEIDVTLPPVEMATGAENEPLLDVTSAASGAVAVPRAEPRAEPLSLLDASLALAAVMRHDSLSWSATADRLYGYDSQPYPVHYAFSSNRVIDFLYALDATEQARDQGVILPEASVLSPRPSYGPRLRETG